MASLTLEPQVVPLRADEQGTLRLGNTRVSLDSVILAFKEGATPEEIVENFDTLVLADVYAVIGYYLKNTPAVEGYLKKQATEAGDLHADWKARWPEHGSYRQVLLARQRSKEQRHAEPGE